MRRRQILGNRRRLAITAMVGLLPFLLSSCGGKDTSPARGCTTSGPGVIALNCFGDGRPDSGPPSQSCQASEYSYYNVNVQLDGSSGPGYVDDQTRYEIVFCTLQITNEAGDVLDDRSLVDSSGAAVCRSLPQIQDNIGVLNYSSCCRAGTKITFGLVADGADYLPLAQGTATATCAPGQVVSTDLVVEKI